MLTDIILRLSPIVPPSDNVEIYLHACQIKANLYIIRRSIAPLPDGKSPLSERVNNIALLKFFLACKISPDYYVFYICCF